MICTQNNGQFSLDDNFTVTELSYVLFSDEDNDGLVELYGRNLQSHLAYFEYDNEPVFGESIEINEIDPTSSFRMADVNGDNINDVYYRGVDAMEIFLSNETAFEYRSTPIFAGGDLLNGTPMVTNFNAGDIDQDGDHDVVIDFYDAEFNESYLVSYLNDGVGTFGGRFIKMDNLLLENYQSFTLGDVNGDNKMDVITSLIGINEVGVLYNIFGEIAPPSATSILEPENQAIVNFETIVFKWTSSERAESYSIQLTEDSLFSENIIELNVNAPDTTLSPDNSLQDNTVYYWRVRANNSGGSSEWSTAFQLTTTSTVSNEDENEDVPHVFSLAQNFPNPFNPTTQISYGLPEATQVKLEVYNILGQSVKTLVSMRQQSGFYTISFDASNLSSSIYVYRLTAGHFTQTKKMLLVK